MIEKLFQTRPVVAASSFDKLPAAVESPTSAVLLMKSRVQDLIGTSFTRFRDEKPILLHFDFVRGLSGDREALQLIHEFARPHAIVSTRGPIIRAARKEGISTIQRIFLIDSLSLQKSIASIGENDPDAIEVMPGIATEVLPLLRAQTDKPIMVGGLVYSERLIRAAFDAGADAVSMSDESLWKWASHQDLTGR